MMNYHFCRVSQKAFTTILSSNNAFADQEGLQTTVVISVFAALFGTLMGALVCFMRMSKSRILSLPARLYIYLLRGTPVLVLLMIVYYLVFASVNIDPVLVAVLAFGLNFGAYVSEMFMTTIESVDTGQPQPGSPAYFQIHTFSYLMMPQALRRVLPSTKANISLVKITSVVGYIAVQDLTKVSDIIRSRTYDAFFPLIMAAVLYLLIAAVFTSALDRLELSVNPRKTV
jgi:polar amino acid transport system substrate-binding protein